MNCKVAERFFQVFNVLQDEMRQPRDYGTGLQLTHSEVGFLDVVHEEQGANVSRISQRLGFTKGAITQTYQKLMQKGLIEQYNREGNKKEKYFRLTELGERTREGHQQFHEEANQSLCDYFSSLKEGEADVILGFLDHLNECTPFCEFPCRCGAKDAKEVRDERDAADGARFARCAGKQ